MNSDCTIIQTESLDNISCKWRGKRVQRQATIVCLAFVACVFPFLNLVSQYTSQHIRKNYILLRISCCAPT